MKRRRTIGIALGLSFRMRPPAELLKLMFATPLSLAEPLIFRGNIGRGQE